MFLSTEISCAYSFVEIGPLKRWKVNEPYESLERADVD